MMLVHVKNKKMNDVLVDMGLILLGGILAAIPILGLGLFLQNDSE